MIRDCPNPPFESHRAYRLLLLVETLLTVIVLALTIGATLGLF